MIYRQGDVLIMRVAELPAALAPVSRDQGRVVLAYGEVTGHAHTILDPDTEFFETAESADRWLSVHGAGATVLHEEHAPIALPPGNYLVRRQREYVPAPREIAVAQFQQFRLVGD